MRALRTSLETLVRWRPCGLLYNILIFRVIIILFLVKGSIKGPKNGVNTDFTFSRAKIFNIADGEELNSRHKEYLYNDWLLECYNKGPFYSILNTYKKK